MYYQTRASREIVRSMSQTSICDMFFSANVAMTRGTVFLLRSLGNMQSTLLSFHRYTYHHYNMWHETSFLLPVSHIILMMLNFFVVRRKKKTFFPSIFPGHHSNLDFDKRFVALSPAYFFFTHVHSGPIRA